MLLTAIPDEEVLALFERAGIEDRWHGSDEPMQPGVRSTTFYASRSLGPTG